VSEPVVLSIGTTHPWNIAGIGLDLVIAQTLGVRALTVVAAITAQDAQGVHAVHPLPADIIAAQLDAIPWEAVAAIRVGALASPESVKVVAAALRSHVTIPAVVDPVIAASRGGRIADDATVAAVRDVLATVESVVLTPNLAEAAALSGRSTVTRDDLADVARLLQKRGVRAVLLKGGHLDGDVADTLATADAVDVFVEPRLPNAMRGTGCTLAMALACELARGASLRAAVQSARAFVRTKIATASTFAGLNVAR